MKLIITKVEQGIGLFGFRENSLVEANIYNTEQTVCVGDIYVGIIDKILPNMDACFVKIGSKDNNVFLPDAEIKKRHKAGDKIIIQITKEASKGKQAMGTTRLSIPGMYCVVTSENFAIEVSAKLHPTKRSYWKNTLKELVHSESLSAETRKLLSSYCLIARTNVGEVKEVSEVVSEWTRLAETMNYVLTKGQNQSAFTKLYELEKKYQKHIMDISYTDIEEIVTDDKAVYMELQDIFTNNPELKNKIRLYTDEYPLRKVYSIDKKLKEALEKKVWLRSGGFLMIEPTEALTVIDVNSGKYYKKSSPEEYYKKVNEEAAVEIARQIKLRNLSGIIIIDFINMKSSQNQGELLDLLTKLVSEDKIETEVIGMTKLGLVEITRKKIEKPLWEQMQ